MEKDCPYKEACPYLNFKNPEKVLAERNYLRARVDEMEITFNLATEKIKLLYKEIASLKEENTILKTEVKEERFTNQQRRKRNPGRLVLPLAIQESPGKNRKSLIGKYRFILNTAHIAKGERKESMEKTLSLIIFRRFPMKSQEQFLKTQKDKIIPLYHRKGG